MDSMGVVSGLSACSRSFSVTAGEFERVDSRTSHEELQQLDSSAGFSAELSPSISHIAPCPRSPQS